MASATAKTKSFNNIVQQLLGFAPEDNKSVSYFNEVFAQFTGEQKQRWQQLIQSHQTRAGYYQRCSDFLKAEQEWRIFLQLQPSSIEARQLYSVALWQKFLHCGFQNSDRSRAINLNHQVLLHAAGTTLDQARILAAEIEKWQRRQPRIGKIIIPAVGVVLAAVIAVVAQLFFGQKQNSTEQPLLSQPYPNQQQIPISWSNAGFNADFRPNSSTKVQNDRGPAYLLQGRIYWQEASVDQLKLLLEVEQQKQTISKIISPVSANSPPLTAGDSLPITYQLPLDDEDVQLRQVNIKLGRIHFSSQQSDGGQRLIDEGPVRLTLRGLRQLSSAGRQVYYLDVNISNQSSPALQQLDLDLVWPGEPVLQSRHTLVSPAQPPLNSGESYNQRIILQAPLEKGILQAEQLQFNFQF